MELQEEIRNHDKGTQKINDYLPSLDGWRAVSILMVLLQHSVGMPGYPKILNFSLLRSIGGVGVRFFFVISGFLITWLLIKEASKFGRISIKSFYIRRIIRIFPVFFLYLTVVYSFQYFSTLKVTSINYLIAATFVGDLWKIGAPLGHLWSLGVEEKFYLFWPVLFIPFVKIKSNRGIFILFAFILLGPVLRGIVDFYQSDKQFELLNNHSILITYDGLAIGCLGAVLLNKFQTTAFQIYQKYNYLLFFFGAILVVLPSLFWIIPGMKMLQPLQDTLQCTGFLILLVQSITYPDFFVYKILNFGIIKHIGVISYSIYIWMGIAEIHPEDIGMSSNFFSGFPGWILIVFILAELSYNFIELPILKFKKPILMWFGLK